MKEPILLPHPAKVHFADGECDISLGVAATKILSEESLNFALGSFLHDDGIPIAFVSSKECGEEGYFLRIVASGISVTYGGLAGAFYALITLRQLLEQNQAGKIPCGEIEDYPALRARGLMVDISRNRIPTLATLHSIIDLIASLKMNELQLYIEGKSFMYPSLNRFYAEDADVLTEADIKELVVYCKERFIDFVPNQNCFGHMSEWLAEEELNPLAECPEGYLFYGIPTPASTLNPQKEESFALVAHQLNDLLPLFSSDKVNIGGDEPFELGEGASRALCTSHGKADVYLSFMEKVFEVAKKHGKVPMMWGDVFKEYSQQYKDRFPQDITILEWGYNADSFTDEVCEIYERAGVRYRLCPGTSLWNTVTGKTEIMRENVKSAARLGKKHGAEGILLTDWGDGGTCQPYVCALLPYATGAAYAWNAEAEQDETIRAYLNRFVFEDETDSFADILADLGRYYLCANTDDVNATKIFKALYVQQTDCMNITEGNFEPLFTNRDFTRLSEQECLKTLEYLQQLEIRAQKVCLKTPNKTIYLREFAWAIEYLMHGCRLGALKAEEKPFTRELINELYWDIERLNAEYKAIWGLRNRRTGLQRSMMRMRALSRKYSAILEI